MIIVYTSVPYGGMLQFTLQLSHSLNNLNKETLALVPRTSEVAEKAKVQFYDDKFPSYKLLKHIYSLRDTILSKNPSLVIISEFSLNSSLLTLALKDKVKILLTVHDAKAHPSYSLIFRIKEQLKRIITKKAFYSADNLLLLSNNTRDMFLSLYPGLESKVRLCPLSAHIPNVTETKPVELQKDSFDDYCLFFGRIDKYKGVSRLLNAFFNQKENLSYKLIIAGNGIFTDEEKSLITKLENKVFIINRYISDSEMKWLFHNCKFVCLPYIEASQSGVLPIAYYYSKPVIVSNLLGLTQFVDDNKTGLIFKTQKELEKHLCTIGNSQYYEDLVINVEKYFQEKLSWEKNLNKLF